MPQSSVPDEQLERILPVVDDLLTRIYALLERLPATTDSALIYQLDPGERR